MITPEASRLTIPGYLPMTWDQWISLAKLSEEEYQARKYACARCRALRNEPCLAGTGLPASRPCPSRLADALADLLPVLPAAAAGSLPRDCPGVSLSPPGAGAGPGAPRGRL